MGRILPFIVALSLSGTSLADEQSVLDELVRMQSAIHNLNYHGTLVYLQNGNVQSMKIVHKSGKGGELERLVNLNGVAREVIRKDDIVTCYLPDEKKVTVGKRHHNWNILSRLIKNDFEELQKYYYFEMEAEDRIAGHVASKIVIKPKDNLRFGYRLWLHTGNALLLKSDLLDTNGNALEQAMFAEISIVDEIPDKMLMASTRDEGFSWFEKKTGDIHKNIGVDDKSVNLPVGFSISSHSKQELQDSSQPVEYWVATDGLASVSIYMERISTDNKAFEGLSRSGAMSMYGMPIGEYQVTVVGEVPEETVKLIAQSVGASFMRAEND